MTLLRIGTLALRTAVIEVAGAIPQHKIMYIWNQPFNSFDDRLAEIPGFILDELQL